MAWFQSNNFTDLLFIIQCRLFVKGNCVGLTLFPDLIKLATACIHLPDLLSLTNLIPRTQDGRQHAVNVTEVNLFWSQHQLTILSSLSVYLFAFLRAVWQKESQMNCSLVESTWSTFRQRQCVLVRGHSWKSWQLHMLKHAAGYTWRFLLLMRTYLYYGVYQLSRLEVYFAVGGVIKCTFLRSLTRWYHGSFKM